MRIKLKIHLALWVLFFVAAIPVLAHAVDGQIKIAQTPSTTFPIVIDQPGSYVLTSNITVSTYNVHCIEITADNVTLDLNGHALIGPGKTPWALAGSGIYAFFMKNIAVKNGTVSNFQDYGIHLTGQNHQIKDIRAYSNGRKGIYAQYSIITNCTADLNNECGIDASYSTITNSSANNNSNGQYVGHGINGVSSTIINCTATHNNLIGIQGYSSIIKNCTSAHNGYTGISGGSKSRVEGNNIRDNGGYGLYLGGHGYAIKNVASNNAGGNFLDGGTNNYMPTSLTAPDAANANVGF